MNEEHYEKELTRLAAKQGAEAVIRWPFVDGGIGIITVVAPDGKQWHYGGRMLAVTFHDTRPFKEAYARVIGRMRMGLEARLATPEE